jgi:hypothetical protein
MADEVAAVLSAADGARDGLAEFYRRVMNTRARSVAAMAADSELQEILAAVRQELRWVGAQFARALGTAPDKADVIKK